MKAVKQISPRAMDEKGAGIYVDDSLSQMRNRRYEDERRVARGEVPLGPRCVRRGRRILYYIEDLDNWLDSIKNGTHQLAHSDFQPDITHLKNQKCMDEAEVGIRKASNSKE